MRYGQIQTSTESYFAVSVEIPETRRSIDTTQCDAHGRRLDGMGLSEGECLYTTCVVYTCTQVNMSYLRTNVMTTFTVDYLMWHHFGRHMDTVNPDMIESYRHYFSRLTKPANLAGFIESWIA
jgi:hypothetical protein